MKRSEKITEINNRLSIAIASEKTKLAEAEVEYRRRVTSLMAQAQIKREEAIDDDDDDEPQENYKPTQWLNGEQWSCAVVAHRILNKLPKLNYPKETIRIDISPSYFGGCGLDFYYVNTIGDSVVKSCELLSRQEPEEQAQKIDLWLKEVEVQIAKAQEIMRKEDENE